MTTTNPTKAKTQTKVVVERTYRAAIEDIWDLWTTKEGFESWWGPEGFRVEVHELDARVGGTLFYDMIADTPEMVAAMKKMSAEAFHRVRARYSELVVHERLVLRSVIDFIPGVEPYESEIVADFAIVGDSVRMSVTLGGMHDETTNSMQKQGFESQLTKLDKRFTA